MFFPPEMVCSKWILSFSLRIEIESSTDVFWHILESEHWKFAFFIVCLSIEFEHFMKRVGEFVGTPPALKRIPPNLVDQMTLEDFEAVIVAQWALKNQSPNILVVCSIEPPNILNFKYS